MNLIVALLAALGSASCYALSSAMQQRAAKQERPSRALDPRLVFRLLRRPLWNLGWLPDVAATGLQAIALRFGPLALVQPFLVSGLFLAIPLEAVFNRARPSVRDLVAVGIGVAGLAVFLTTAAPGAGVPDPSMRAWLGVGSGATAAVAGCLALAARSHGATRGVLLGVATGVLEALAAALLKPVTTKITTDPLNVLADWHVYALVVVGIAALVLNQHAFQHGPLAAPLTALTLVDPVVSVIFGVTAFRETLSGGAPRIAIETAAIVVMGFGIWLTSTRRR